jgi:glutamate---cysteine ligase / carboxylate-amine ligase
MSFAVLDARSRAGAALGAFQGFGVELEYMVVKRDTLDVAALADRVLQDGTRERGALAWSNELVAHVMELKNPHPTAELAALAAACEEEVHAMNAELERLGARLMPGGMHPWMDPARETRLWPRDGEVYGAYDRIFGCRSHGWANLQSMHINLPFADDNEFARLHAAVRLVLPILPAIAASSPYANGRAAGALDYRLEVYGANSARVPQMNGEIIPEPVASRAQYEREILQPLYDALAPLDGAGVLRHEWANARGAIARFDRNAIEIRVLDSQECPAADIALGAAIIDLVWLLYQRESVMLPTGELARLLRACVRDGERACIDSPAYVEALIGERRPFEARELWARLGERMACAPRAALWQPVLDFVLERGPLARRLLAAAGREPSRERLAGVYAKLCECLEHGALFDPIP